MKTKFILIAAAFLLFTHTVVFAQKKFVKKMVQIEDLIQKGKLKSASSKNESIVNDSKKENEYAVKSYLNKGVILQGIGRGYDYERSLNEALALAKRAYGDTGKVLAEAYLTISQTHYDFGNYRKALEAHKKAIEIFQKSKQKSSSFYPNQTLLLAQINTKLGYLKTADSLVVISTPLFYNRIVKTETVIDPKGKSKVEKLSKTELNNRKQAYAWSLSLKADLLREKGLLSSADSAYKTTNAWISKNISSKNPALANNLISIASMEEQKGNLRTANNLYTKAFSAVKSRQDMYYFHGFEKLVYGKIIKDEFKSTPNKSLRLWGNKTRMHYKGDNIYHGDSEIMDEWFVAHKYKNHSADERLNNFMEGFKLVPKFSPSHIKVQDVHVFINFQRRQFKAAEDTLLALLEVAKELYGEKTPAYHLRKLDLAELYLKKVNNLKKAEEIYLESFVGVVSKDMSPRNEKYVWYLNDLGSLYTAIENFNKSSDYLQKAEKQATINFGSDSPKHGVVLGNLANTYLNQGKYTLAKQMFEQAEEYLNKGDMDDYTPTYAITYQNIAEGYSTFGLYDKSEKCLLKAERILELSLSKGFDIAGNSSPDEIAAYYLRTGKNREAEKLLKQSIFDKEKVKGGNAPELIKPLNLLGKLYFTTGDYGQSETYLNRATKLSISYSGDTTLKYAESLKILRKLYAALGDYQKAEQTCLKQIAITTRILGRDNINVSEALADLAINRFYLGQSANESRKMLNESNEIVRKQLGAENPSYINGLKTLSFLQLETNKLSSADSLISISEKYWEQKLGKDNIYTPEFDLIKGDILRKQAKYDLALEKYAHAQGLYKSKFSSKHPDYVKTISRIAKTNYIKGDYKNSLSAIKVATEGYYSFISKYFPVLSFGEKTKYWDLIKSDFEFFNSLALKMKDQNPELVGQMYDYVLATKALLLSNSIKVRQRILSSGNTVLIDKFNSWNSKKDLLTKSLSYSSEQLKQENINPEKLESEIENLEKDLSSSSEEFAQGFENKSFRWKDVRKALKSDEAAIEIIRFRHYTTSFSDSIIYAALIVTSQTSSNPEIVVLPNGKQLEKKYVKYYRNTIKYKNEDEMSYDVFWKDIEAKLKNINTLFLSCDGVYNQINIETLEDDNGKYALDKYNIVLVSNTKDLVLNSINEKKKGRKVVSNNITLIGNPLFYASNSKIVSRSIPQLSGAEKEANEISELYGQYTWKNNLLIGNQADEEKIKTMPGARILHVASHGYFQPDQSYGKQDENAFLKKNEINPLLRSGLLMSGAGDIIDNNFTASNVNSQNGILTAYEAMNMNLENTELVTLSACETGLGDVQIGEGVAGLQRSFLVAGADNVVMSLFKVSDEITEKLMLTFYKKWLKSGDKRKSFIDAKREIKVQHPEALYWGSFIMIGIN
jgi:CHAT domain-containing protein